LHFGEGGEITIKPTFDPRDTIQEFYFSLLVICNNSENLKSPLLNRFLNHQIAIVFCMANLCF
jgi:hypothetical protein